MKILFKNAFTLVELLIVVSIIGILSGIALVVVNPQRQRDIALDTVNKQTLSNMAQSIEGYFLASGSLTYPANLYLTGGSPIPLLQLPSSQTPPGLVYKRNSSNNQFCLCLSSLVRKDIYFWFSSTSAKLEEINENCSKSCQ